MGLWYQDVLKGFALTATGATAGAATGGRLGGLTGGIYGAVKAATGKTEDLGRAAYQTALPAAGIGALFASSAIKTQRLSSSPSYKVSQTELLKTQASFAKQEAAGLLSGLWRGVSKVPGALAKAPGAIVSGLGAAGRGVSQAAGAAPSALLAAGQSGFGLPWLMGQGREAGESVLGGATNILSGGGETPTQAAAAPSIELQMPGDSGGAVQEAGVSGPMLFIVIGLIATFIVMGLKRK